MKTDTILKLRIPPIAADNDRKMPQNNYVQCKSFQRCTQGHFSTSCFKPFLSRGTAMHYRPWTGKKPELLSPSPNSTTLNSKPQKQTNNRGTAKGAAAARFIRAAAFQTEMPYKP